MVVLVVVAAASLAGPAVGAIAVLLWAQLPRAPMRALGFKAPPNWLPALAFVAASQLTALEWHTA